MRPAFSSSSVVAAQEAAVHEVVALDARKRGGELVIAEFAT